MANEKNGAAQAKEKAQRSKKLYWVIGTIIVAAVLFTLYYSVYVASQQAYYTERAFRLLSSMSGKFSLQVQIVDNVLRASTSFTNVDDAGYYVHHVPPSRLDEHNFIITQLHKADPKAKPKRNGTLALFMPELQNSFRIRADYREGLREPDLKEKAKGMPATPKAPSLRHFPRSRCAQMLILIPLSVPLFMISRKASSMMC